MNGRNEDQQQKPLPHRLEQRVAAAPQKVAKDFIPGGETVDDGSVKVNWLLNKSVRVSAYIQYEKWLAPIVAPGPQTNWTSLVEMTFSSRSWAW